MRILIVAFFFSLSPAYRSLNRRLNRRLLVQIRREKVLFDAQRHDPEHDAEAQGEDGAEGNQVAAELEDGAALGGEAEEGEDKGAEDDAGVGDASVERELAVEQVADGLAAVDRVLVEEALDDEAEAELDGAGGEEEDVDGEGAEEHLVGHLGRIWWSDVLTREHGLGRRGKDLGRRAEGDFEAGRFGRLDVLNDCRRRPASG